MPCRALEAFRLGRRFKGYTFKFVLMPCRALEAFRPSTTSAAPFSTRARLNALSGIGGVQTMTMLQLQFVTIIVCLNALSGIGGVQTYIVAVWSPRWRGES